MRRAALIVTSLVTLLTFIGCDIYFDDDDRKNRPRPGKDPDAGCDEGPGSPDGGFLPDGGTWPDGGTGPDGGTRSDAGFLPDGSPDW